MWTWYCCWIFAMWDKNNKNFPRSSHQCPQPTLSFGIYNIGLILATSAKRLNHFWISTRIVFCFFPDTTHFLKCFFWFQLEILEFWETEFILISGCKIWASQLSNLLINKNTRNNKKWVKKRSANLLALENQFSQDASRTNC